MRSNYVLFAIGIFSGCQCFVPVVERTDGSTVFVDAGDGGDVVRCKTQYLRDPNVRLGVDSDPTRPGDESVSWVSSEERQGCIVYSFTFNLFIGVSDPTGWEAIAGARICNACAEPALVATTYYGTISDRENALGADTKKIFNEPPTYNYSGADLGFGLRDSAGVTVPSSCISQQDVGCWGLAWGREDAGSPTLNVRSTELAPGESLALAGMVHYGVSPQDAEPGKDAEVPLMPFEEWRGYLFGTQSQLPRMNLNGKLDLVAFLPRAFLKSEMEQHLPSKPRDQACAHYNFPLIGSHCRERLDAGGYSRNDFVEVAIVDVQLPDEVVIELKNRASRRLADAGN